MKQQNLILDLSIQFSLNVIKYTNTLDEMRKYAMSKQLFRSGTSIGANVRESQFGESRSDFIHKLKIAEKEAAETEYWLMLCDKSEGYPSTGNLQAEVGSIRRVLSKIIRTSKEHHVIA